MNDKKFIEELKLKREEYGVSQKRLAVACGISREHYNRIETGKLPLTEELKAEIQKQLERFNPCSYWLTISVSVSLPQTR